VPEKNDLGNEIFTADEKKELKVIFLEHELRTRYGTSKSSYYESAYKRSLARLPSREESAETINNCEYFRALLSQDNTNRWETGLLAKIDEWREAGKPIDIAALIRLDNVELDKLVTVTESLLAKELTATEQTIASYFSATEIEADQRDLREAATLYSSGVSSKEAFVDTLKKKINQWTTQHKPGINTVAILQLPWQERLIVLDGLSNASLPELKDFSVFPSDKKELPDPELEATSNELTTPAPETIFQAGSLLGQGALGKVYEARPKGSDEDYSYVAKIASRATWATQTQEDAVRDLANEDNINEIIGNIADPSFPKSFFPRTFGMHPMDEASSIDFDKKTLALISERIFGIRLYDFAILLGKQVERGERTVDEANNVAWAFLYQLTYAAINLAENGLSHGDLSALNTLVEEATAEFKIVDHGEAQLWEIPPHIVLNQPSSQDPISKIYPVDAVRLGAVTWVFLSKLFPYAPIPDLHSIWLKLGRQDIFRRRKDQRLDQLGLQILETLHVDLDKSELSKLEIIPGSDATLDQIKEEIAKKLPERDLTITETPEQENSLRLQYQSKIEQTEKQIQETTEQFLELFSLPIRTSFSRFVTRPYLYNTTSPFDIRDVDSLVDTPHNLEAATRTIKKVFALEKIQTRQLSDSSTTVYQAIIRDTMALDIVDEKSRADVIEKALQNLQAAADYPKLDLNIYKEVAAEVIERALNLSNRLYSSFNDLNPENKAAKIIANMIVNASKSPPIAPDISQISAALLKHLRLDYVPMINKDGYINKEAKQALDAAGNESNLEADSRNYLEDANGNMQVAHPTSDFSKAVIEAFCEKILRTAQTLQATFESDPNLRDDTDALLDTIGLHSKSAGHRYAFWKEISIRLNWVSREIAKDQQRTVPEGDEDDSEKNTIEANAAQRYKDDRFQAEGNISRVPPPTYPLPIIQQRWNTDLLHFHQAMEFATLREEEKIADYVDGPDRLHEEEQKALNEREKLRTKLTNHLQELIPVEELPNQLVEVNDAAIIAAQNTQKALQRQWKNRCNDYTNDINNLSEEINDLKKNENPNDGTAAKIKALSDRIVALRNARGKLSFGIELLNRMNDVTVTLAPLIKAKELIGDPLECITFKQAIADKRIALTQRLNYAASIDNLWQRAFAENNLRQWIENHEKLQPHRERQHKILLDSIDLIKDKLSALAEQVFLPPQMRALQQQLSNQLDALNRDRQLHEESENEFQHLFASIKTGVETLSDHTAPQSLLSELLQKKTQADQVLEHAENGNALPHAAFQIVHQLMPSDVQWQNERLLNELLENEDIEATLQQSWHDKENNRPNYFDQVDEALETAGLDHLRLIWSGLDTQLRLSAAHKEIYADTRPEEVARNTAACRETFSLIQNVLTPFSRNAQEIALTKAFSKELIDAIIKGDAEKVDILLLQAPSNFDCQSALATAVSMLEPEIVNKLLKAYPKVNRTHALAEAANHGVFEQVRLLMSGKPIGLDLVPALISAARNDNVLIVAELFSSPLVNLDAAALLRFAEAGLTDLVDTLLSRNPRVNRADALEASLKNALDIKPEDRARLSLKASPAASERVADRLLSDAPANLVTRILLEAIAADQLYKVHKLLSARPDIDREPLLAAAVSAGRVDIARILFLRTVDPDSVRGQPLPPLAPFSITDRMNRMNGFDFSAIGSGLHAATLVNAVRTGNLGMVNLALEFGYPNIDVAPALTVAIKAGHTDMVNLILPYCHLSGNLAPAFATAIRIDNSDNRDLFDRLLETISDAALVASLVSAVRAGNMDVIKSLSSYLPDPNIDLAPAVAAAAQINDVATVNTLLSLNTLSPLDCSRAVVAAASAGYEDIVNTLLANNNVTLSPGALAFATIAAAEHPTITNRLQSHALAGPSYANSFVNAAAANDINAVKSYLKDGADDIDVIWPLEAAARNGHLEIIDRLLQYASENINLDHALEAAARNGHLEIVDRLLNQPSANLNRDGALEAAARGGHTDIIRSLMRDAPPIVNCDWAVEAAATAGHVEVVNTLLSSQNWEELANARRLATTAGANHPQIMAIVRRPQIYFNRQSPKVEKERSLARQQWIAMAMGLQHRADSEIAPPLSHAIQSWLPSSLNIQEREEITRKFQLIEDNPDPEIRESAKAFAAFVYLAEGTSDYRRHKKAYKARMWNLLEALVDKNHPSLGKISDQEHALLRERVMATSVAALEACTDRLSKGFQLLETAVEFEEARSFTEMEQHEGLAKKMYGRYLKSRLADLKAIELKIDGYKFSPDHVFPEGTTAQSINRSVNIDEQLTIVSFYDSHLDKKYQTGDVQASMAHVGFLVAKQRQAYPTKTAGRSYDQTVEDLNKEAEEILAELSNGKGESKKLEALIDSANAVLLTDGREVLSRQTASHIMTFEDFMAREYGLFDDFIKAKHPKVIDQVKAPINRLKAQEKELSSKVVEPPRFVRPDGKPDHMPTLPRAPYSDSDNADPAVKAEYEKTKEQYRKDLEQYNRDKSARQKIYQQWHDTLTTEGISQGDLYAHRDEVQNALYEAEHNALPNALKDLYRQYTSAKPLINELKKKHGKGYDCHWTPIVSSIQRDPSITYKIVRNTTDGITLLTFDHEDVPSEVFSINTGRLNSLHGQPNDAVPAVGEKVHLQWSDDGLIAVRSAAPLRDQPSGRVSPSLGASSVILPAAPEEAAVLEEITAIKDTATPEQRIAQEETTIRVSPSLGASSGILPAATEEVAALEEITAIKDTATPEQRVAQEETTARVSPSLGASSVILPAATEEAAALEEITAIKDTATPEQRVAQEETTARVSSSLGVSSGILPVATEEAAGLEEITAIKDTATPEQTPAQKQVFVEKQQPASNISRSAPGQPTTNTQEQTPETSTATTETARPPEVAQPRRRLRDRFRRRRTQTSESQSADTPSSEIAQPGQRFFDRFRIQRQAREGASQEPGTRQQSGNPFSRLLDNFRGGGDGDRQVHYLFVQPLEVPTLLLFDPTLQEYYERGQKTRAKKAVDTIVNSLIKEGYSLESCQQVIKQQITHEPQEIIRNTIRTYLPTAIKAADEAKRAVDDILNKLIRTRNPLADYQVAINNLINKELPQKSDIMRAYLPHAMGFAKYAQAQGFNLGYKHVDLPLDAEVKGNGLSPTQIAVNLEGASHNQAKIYTLKPGETVSGSMPLLGQPIEGKLIGPARKKLNKTQESKTDLQRANSKTGTIKR